MQNPTQMAGQPEALISSETVLSVEQLNHQIRQLIESEFQTVWVRGELSNFKPHSSGHFYFSLKDAKSQIKAVMFRGYNAKLKFKPHDGLEVLVRGKVTVYEPRGDYQISVEVMEPVGAGALQKAFEQLKLKLKNEGLFETSRKRALPVLPKHIAIVTSPTGAAIRDMINVLTRRYKAVNMTLVPTIVQGEAAAPQICEALKKAYRLPGVDVVIVGRGGGSIEDLWAFNEEIVARTIAASPVPIISAVGHEIDFTIADFVADVRAPTPSAAAELVVKNASDLSRQIDGLYRMLRNQMAKFMQTEKQKLLGLCRGLVDPKKRIMDLILRRDELETRLHQSTQRFFEKSKMRVQMLVQALVSPQEVFNQIKNKQQMLNYKLVQNLQKILENKKYSWQKSMSLLDSLSPLRVVDRGYSLVTYKKQLIKDSQQLKTGDEIQIQFAKGQVDAIVK